MGSLRIGDHGIDTIAGRDAALSWITYWTASHATGEQSWLADEEALGDIMVLRRQIAEYDAGISRDQWQNRAQGEG